MSFSDNLLKWYDDQSIKFPWRNISNPYYTWVSEIMLQQTQVKTVIPYFKKWIKIFQPSKVLQMQMMKKFLKTGRFRLL